MLETISAEIIYCRERARLAREKADTATTPEAKNDCLAAEARWLALARSYEQQDRLSKALGGNEPKEPVSRSARERTYALDPEVVAIVSSAFHAVFAELGSSNSDETVALRVAWRIIELAVRGERDPERLKAVVLAWVTK
jgi:ubiquitin